MEEMLLNPSQKRFLTVTLREVEDKLTQLKGLLQNSKEKKFFSLIQDEIDQEAKDILNKKIYSLIAHSADLKRLFDLRQSEFVLRYMIKATSVYLSIQLEEAMSRRLKGHGETMEGLKETLDPKLNKMKQILEQMGSIV